MIKKVINFFKEEEGAGLAEYALLLVLIAVACLATLPLLGTTIAGVFTRITNALLGVTAG
jgi:Flp pilus assembly pilin Flp